MHDTRAAHVPALPTAAFDSPQPTRPLVDLDAYEGHVETGDPTEVGHVLPLVRYRNRQPAGVDVADDHRHDGRQMSGSRVVAHFSTSML